MNRIDEIINHVARSEGLTVEDLKGPSRKAEIVQARFIAIYILRELGLSFQKIGDEFSRDHSTIMNAVKKVDTFKHAEAKINQYKCELSIVGGRPYMIKKDILYMYCPNEHLFKTYQMQIV